MSRPTSSMGTSAWTVEVLDRICLNGSVPKSARSWAGGQFLAPASGLPMRLRRPWSGPGCDSGGRSLRSPGQGIPAICFATPTVVDVQRTISAACGSAGARQIPDEKSDELFAALGSHRDRLWWRLGCRPGRGHRVLGVTCGDADVSQQLITVAAPGRDALDEGLGQRGGGSENGPPERQRAMVAGHGVGAPMVDRLDPGGEQPFSSIRSPAPPTRRTSTLT